MAEIRETEVERDADGRIVGYRERVSEHVDDDKPVRRKGGGFGWGLLFGALLIAIAIVAFAYSQGGFQQAGVEADQATAQLEEQTDDVVERTDNALQGAADTTQDAVDNTTTTTNETSDTATN
ncbi:MAG TPA: hypothetical protein VFO00_04330 [Vitreimonas sp.]|nr:hypothetical protein [Vitreimonas sp.]